MSRKASRPLWMLLAAVALLGAGALAELRRDRMLQPQPLTAIKLARVHKIDVVCPACVPLHFDRIQGQWGMVAPYVLPADPAFIEHLLAVAHAPTRRRLGAADVDPEQSGLNAPVATLSLDDRALVFGGTDPLTGDRYVGTGSEIAMVQDRYLHLLQAAPEEALDRHPIPPGMRFQAIEVDGLTLPATAWPAWKSALATVVRPAADASAGRRIGVRREDGSSIDFQFVIRAGDAILRRENPPLEYFLDSAQLSALALDSAAMPQQP